MRFGPDKTARKELNTMAGMVSRHDSPGPSRRRTPNAALFDTWRYLLGRMFGGIRRSLAALPGALWACGAAVVHIADGSAFSRPEDDTLRYGLAVGSTFTVLGSALAASLSPGRSVSVTVATAGISAMWVFARLAVMRLAANANGRAPEAPIEAAWAAGALLHLVAFTPSLSMLAWLGGALLSFRALHRSGVSTTDAAYIISWGYGFEIAGFALVAVVRDVTVALRLFTGA